MIRRGPSTVPIASVVSLGGFIFGFDASVISGVVGFVVPQFGLDDLQTGLLVGAPTLAGLASGLSAGPLADYVGRKKVLIVLALLYTVSAVASAVAPNYETLVAGRFIGGFAFASLGIAPMYIAEVAPSERRGLLVSFNQFNIVIGLSAAYFANYLLLGISQTDASWVKALGIDRHAWRWMLGIEALPAAAWLVLLAFVPESPRWLAMKGRPQEARSVLRRLQESAQVERTLAEIRSSVAHASVPLRERIRELFRPALRLPIAIGLIVGIVQQVTGVNAIYFYAPSIFEQSGVGTNAAFAQATLIGITNVVFTIAAMLLIDRLGRKPLLLLGLAGVIVSTSLTGYGFDRARYALSEPAVAGLSAEIDREALQLLVDVEFTDDRSFKGAVARVLGEAAARAHQAELIGAAIRINPAVVLAGILGFVASFAISLGPVMWVLFSEIFPNRIRGIAMAFVGFFNALSSFAVQLLFPWELSNLGSASTFFVYAALGGVGLVLVLWLVPETKGRSLERLEVELARGHAGPLRAEPGT